MLNHDERLSVVTERAVRIYLAVQPGEQVVVLVDSGTSAAIPEALSASIKGVGAEPIMITVPRRRSSGEELPSAVLSAVAAANVVVSACSRSPYHSSLKPLVQEAGVRGTLNSPPNVDGWLNGAMQYDFVELRPVAARLRHLLTNGSRVHVTSPAGTDVTMSIEGRDAVGWLSGMAQEPCQTVAWPGGEVSLPPLEGRTNGRVVLEVAMTDIGGLVTPVVWEVADGEVVEISGGEEASRLRELVRSTANATNIAELGIGINPLARFVDDITEAKKRRGTAHIALGDNANGYGGNVACDVHIDGLLRDVTVVVDDTPIVLDGQLLV